MNVELQTCPVFGNDEAAVSFEPLSYGTLEVAILIANSVFPECVGSLESPDVEYRATLHPRRYRSELQALGVDAQQHWIVTRDGEIVGLTGLQHKTVDPFDVVWLGWFCVAPQVRGRKLGKRILQQTMSMARDQGYRILRLWTTTRPSEVTAQELYRRMGFRVTRKEPNPGTPFTRIYRRRKL